MLYNTQNPHGGDVYAGDTELDFSANTNPLGTPERVIEAVCASARELHRYPDPYCRRLVDAIARSESVPREFILCGAGAAELIYAFCEAARPLTAAELAPTFAEYSLALERTGGRMIRIPLREEDGFALTDRTVCRIEQAHPDAVFICNPNNPTGRAAQPRVMERILDLCERLGARLMVDECFMDLSDAGESLKPMLSRHKNLIILKAFTKSYGLAGLRLGYCLSADGGLLKAMSSCTQPWNVSAAAQAAGVSALCEVDFLKKTRSLIFAERARLTAELKASGLAVYDSNVNFLLLRGPKGLDNKLLERRIRIRSCSNFCGLGEGFYRIAVKLPEENSALISAVQNILTEGTNG